MHPLHVPVLLDEVLEALAVKPGGNYVDGTLGPGGHARAVLERSAPGGKLLGLDRDAVALTAARSGLSEFLGRLRVEQSDFRRIPEWVPAGSADGVLLDLGVSTLQLDSPERGFGFRQDGPLDMRMDQAQQETAADVVNKLPEHVLADILYRLGEEPASRRVARAIVEARRVAPIRTTAELAGIVRRSARRARPGLDPATRTFQALRIHVNRELSGLKEALERIALCLAPGGRFVVIAFHSLEDREVKHAFRGLQGQGFQTLTRKPLRPSPDEVRANPRSRSARLRALARVEIARHTPPDTRLRVGCGRWS